MEHFEFVVIGPGNGGAAPAAICTPLRPGFASAFAPGAEYGSVNVDATDSGADPKAGLNRWPEGRGTWARDIRWTAAPAKSKARSHRMHWQGFLLQSAGIMPPPECLFSLQKPKPIIVLQGETIDPSRHFCKSDHWWAWSVRHLRGPDDPVLERWRRADPGTLG